MATDSPRITIYDKHRALNGLNLFTSGHKPAAFLLDMEGNILHEWSIDTDQIWPDGFNFSIIEIHKYFWQRAHLFENGDLLAIFESIGIIKIDKNSNLIWANECRAHHDIYIDRNGNIYTLTLKESLAEYDSGFKGPIIEDFITILDPDGEILKSVSLVKCLLNSKFSSFMDDDNKIGDVFHTNTIELIETPVKGLETIFKEGLVLVSIRELHTIALVDLEAEKVTWALTGMWRFQHHPTLLENGNILIFDNRRTNNLSNVIEFKPLTQEIIWQYKGDRENNFFSRTVGANQRLPNGNTLITESDRGRAFEVTEEKEIVWEFNSPFRAGENNEMVATLLELIRIDPDSINFLDPDAFSN